MRSTVLLVFVVTLSQLAPCSLGLSTSYFNWFTCRRYCRLASKSRVGALWCVRRSCRTSRPKLHWIRKRLHVVDEQDDGNELEDGETGGVWKAFEDNWQENTASNGWQAMGEGWGDFKDGDSGTVLEDDLKDNDFAGEKDEGRSSLQLLGTTAGEVLQDDLMENGFAGEKRKERHQSGQLAGTTNGEGLTGDTSVGNI
ncbi:hypothetical protein BaRGS_00034651 [Batillaria attramentaria]|uniref:Uncharacterized protein n=1 Tax=Batillaria attramentaria TaxID=370345 RepID=A0ABD0JI93_9CAEN